MLLLLCYFDVIPHFFDVTIILGSAPRHAIFLRNAFAISPLSLSRSEASVNHDVVSSGDQNKKTI